MPRIRCHYLDCVFLDDGYCGAAAVEFDPEEGCLTFKATGDVGEDEAEWDDEGDLDELEEWDEVDVDEEDEELWVDDEEEL
jgi:hypothetical protein